MIKKNILVLYNDSDKFEVIKYVINFIFRLPICNCHAKIEFLQKDNAIVKKYNIIINYSDERISDAINIIEGHILDIANSYNEILEIKPQEYVNDGKILYGITKNPTSYAKSFRIENVIYLDIIETIFFHISRLEEFYCPSDKKDKHSRMKSKEQFLVRYQLEKIPIVDNICYAFLESIGMAKNVETKIILTHDIDVLKKYPNPYKFLRGVARILFIKKDFKGSLIKYIFYYIKSVITRQDPFNTFEWLFRLKKFENKIVFFMSGGLTKFDNLYKINDNTLDKVFSLAKKAGYEFGIHPSYSTNTNTGQFLTEKQLLEERLCLQIANSRQHILHFDFETTPKILEESYISNDYTIGYQDRIGFRAGTGFSFLLWNHLEGREFNVIETPLIIMDGCLLIEAKYDIPKAIKINEEFRLLNFENTQITYNFHNSIFDPVILDSEKLKKFYLSL